MKRILTLSIIIILLVLSFNIFSESKDTEQVSEPFTGSFTGSLKSIGGNWYLNTGEDFFQLNLAPDEFLTENKLTLEAKMVIEIIGVIAEEEIIVYEIKSGKTSVSVRDKAGAALWSEENANLVYVVSPNKCISCRLCVSACPTDAITMIKGKAVIDEAKCIGCGICEEGNGKFKGCPTSAISKKE